MATTTWKSFTNVALSNGNLTASLPNHTVSTIANNGKTTGKWYWEVDADISTMIGVTSVTTGTQIYNSVNHRGYFGFDGKKWGGTSGTTYGSAFGAGDVISVLLDLDNGTLEFWKNGVSQGVAFSDIKLLGIVYPSYTSGGSPTVATANFGASPMKHSIPNGYMPYNGYSNKFLISSEDEILSVIDDGIKLLPSSLESVYVNHGMSKNFAIDVNTLRHKKQIIKSTSTLLGSGKVFKQKIDKNNIPIKKASIT